MASQRKPAFRVLLLEDEVADLANLTQALEEVHPECRLLRVDTRKAFERALDSFAPDVVLSNPGVAELTALQALRLTQNRLPGCPFLLIARTFGQMSWTAFGLALPILSERPRCPASRPPLPRPSGCARRCGSSQSANARCYN